MTVVPVFTRLLARAWDIKPGDSIPCVGDVTEVTRTGSDVTLHVKFASQPSYTFPGTLELWITRVVEP